MGQYWFAANVDKKEYLDPWKLGTGAKLWEQLASPPTGKALVVLLANQTEPRGGGDLEQETDTAKDYIGRWAGDRVIMVGDYAEKDDHPTIDTELVYQDISEKRYRDISHYVKKIIKTELEGIF